MSRVNVEGYIFMIGNQENSGERHSMKSNNTLAVRIGVFLIVITVFFIGGVLWWNDAVSPFDASATTPVVFSIQKGDSVRDVATNLAKNELIRSSVGFYMLVKVLGIERNLQVGEYRLSQSMDGKSIALSLTHGVSDIWVTTLEGWRVEEIASQLAKKLDIPEKEFLNLASEGYMFPDTYRFPSDASAAGVLDVIEKNFDEKAGIFIRDNLKKTTLTEHEILTLASIVEREGLSDDDRPLIAGILLNRLEKDMPLQADATLQYILGYQTNEKTWWKKMLTNDDKLIDSPYNTYKFTGLPPGPIASPGLASIKAVINPKSTDYIYYLHGKDGAIHPAKTLDEHEANIEKYIL